jgi:hypothetical protein
MFESLGDPATFAITADQIVVIREADPFASLAGRYATRAGPFRKRRLRARGARPRTAVT